MPKKTVFTFLAFIFLAAFTTFSQGLPEGEWRLLSYNFEKKIDFPIDGMEITLNVRANGKLGGKSGCNVYGGEHSFENAKLKIGDLISTQMACEEPSMQFERMFFETLQSASRFSVVDRKLTITNAKTGNFLRFARVEPRKKGT